MSLTPAKPLTLTPRWVILIVVLTLLVLAIFSLA